MLPWLPLRRIARNRLPYTTDPFAQTHNLLALGGAGDVEALETWLRSPKPHLDDNYKDRLLRLIGKALLAYASEKYHRAAEILDMAVPEIEKLTGSQMQNRLFRKILETSRRRANGGADYIIGMPA